MFNKIVINIVPIAWMFDFLISFFTLEVGTGQVLTSQVDADNLEVGITYKYKVI